MRNKFYFGISLSSRVRKLSKLNESSLPKIIGSFELAKVIVTYRNWRVVKNKTKIKTYNHNISIKQACTTFGSRAKFAQNFVYMTCLIKKVTPVHEIWCSINKLKNSSSDFFSSVFSSLTKPSLQSLIKFQQALKIDKNGLQYKLSLIKLTKSLI